MKKKKDHERKDRKFLQFAVLCVSALLIFAACGNIPTSRERVFAAFEEQKELICGKIADYSAGDEVEWDDLEGVIGVDTYSSGLVEFTCIIEGILTSGVEAGFYYAPDNEPCTVGWLHGELTEDGNGYSYSDGTDNRYYTEQICENFYYYIVTN